MSLRRMVRNASVSAGENRAYDRAFLRGGSLAWSRSSSLELQAPAWGAEAADRLEEDATAFFGAEGDKAESAGAGTDEEVAAARELLEPPALPRLAPAKASG